MSLSEWPGGHNPSLPCRALNLRRLDGRLQHLYHWACTQTYDHVWDLCCDHGRLGMHLYLGSQGTPQVHLVDSVLSIMAKLKVLFGDVDPQRLSFTAQDASRIKLGTGSHLIVIAGVGGDTAQLIIQGLLAGLRDAAKTQIRLLISANNRTYDLRKYLHHSVFELQDEAFVREKKYSYEHLNYHFAGDRLGVEKNPGKKTRIASVAGEKLWQPLCDAKQRYLQKLIMHYERQAEYGHEGNAREAANAYRALLTNQSMKYY